MRQRKNKKETYTGDYILEKIKRIVYTSFSYFLGCCENTILDPVSRKPPFHTHCLL